MAIVVQTLARVVLLGLVIVSTGRASLAQDAEKGVVTGEIPRPLNLLAGDPARGGLQRSLLPPLHLLVPQL